MTSICRFADPAHFARPSPAPGGGAQRLHRCAGPAHL